MNIKLHSAVSILNFYYFSYSAVGFLILIVCVLVKFFKLFVAFHASLCACVLSTLIVVRYLTCVFAELNTSTSASVPVSVLRWRSGVLFV